MKIKFTFLLFGLIAFGLANLNYSNGVGSILGNGYTGAPGENTGCTGAGCHADNNGFEAAITIELIDAAGGPVTAYIPDSLYDFVATITTNAGTPGGYGVQLLSLKDADDSDLVAWSSPSANAKIITGANTGRSYVEQTNTSASNVFTVKWRAPAAGTGGVSFYGVGNAVDGTGGNTGDDPTPTVKLKVPEKVPNSIKNLAYEGVNLTVFPNPVVNDLNLNISGELRGTYHLEIIDVTGKTISKSTVNLAGNGSQEKIDASDLIPGIYSLRLHDETGFSTTQFVKF